MNKLSMMAAVVASADLLFLPSEGGTTCESQDSVTWTRKLDADMPMETCESQC